MLSYTILLSFAFTDGIFKLVHTESQVNHNNLDQEGPNVHMLAWHVIGGIHLAPPSFYGTWDIQLWFLHSSLKT